MRIPLVGNPAAGGGLEPASLMAAMTGADVRVTARAAAYRLVVG